MKQLFPVILASIQFCACGNNSASNNPNVLELSNTEIIEIEANSPHLIRADQAKLLSTDDMLAMVSSIDYIKLDSSEPMGDQINKMIVTKDKILILDSFTTQRIFAFDKTGKLMFQIKNKGRGPNEYLSIWDMQVDTIRNEILVNDALARSYLYFSLENGQFLRREKGVANCYLTRIDSLYINYQLSGQDFNEKEDWMILISNKDSILYKGFEVKPLQEGNYIANSFINDYDGGLLYTPIYSDTVYQFSSPCEVFAKYVIRQEKSVWKLYDQNLNPMEINKRIKENNFTSYNAKFLAAENYVSFCLERMWGEAILLQPYFWDKRTDVVYTWDMTQEMGKRPVVRDLIQIPIAVHNNTFFGTFSPAVPKEYRKDLNPKLKKMLDDSQDGDNPIVVCYKLK